MRCPIAARRAGPVGVVVDDPWAGLEYRPAIEIDQGQTHHVAFGREVLGELGEIESPLFVDQAVDHQLVDRQALGVLHQCGDPLLEQGLVGATDLEREVFISRSRWPSICTATSAVISTITAATKPETWSVRRGA